RIMLFLLQCLGQGLNLEFQPRFVIDSRQIFGAAWTCYGTISDPEQTMNDEREQNRQPLRAQNFTNTWLNQGDFNHTDFFLVLQRITDKNFTLAGFGQSASG